MKTEGEKAVFSRGDAEARRGGETTGLRLSGLSV